MKILLQSNTSDKRQIGKKLTTIKTCQGTLKEQCSIIEPVILISANLSNTSSINYMYIEEFKRYYFVTDIISIRHGLIQIKGHVDVLESFKKEIKSLNAIIERQENNYNMYLDDSEFTVYNYRNYTIKEFDIGFLNSYYFYLTVAGGWMYTLTGGE